MFNRVLGGIMEIQVIDVKEDEEGWAKVTLELDPEARDAVISSGLKSIICKAITPDSGFDAYFSDKA